MGVRINLSKTFKTAVAFSMLDSEGKAENSSFMAEFKRLTRDEIAEVRKLDSDSAMARQVLVGWTMQDVDTKADVPFTPEAMESFFEIAGVAGVTMLRFLETVGASREKN